MARERKLENPVTLFVTVEAKQHETLRVLAFQARRSLADLVREALDQYMKKERKNVAAATIAGRPAAHRMSR